MPSAPPPDRGTPSIRGRRQAGVALPVQVTAWSVMLAVDRAPDRGFGGFGNAASPSAPGIISGSATGSGSGTYAAGCIRSRNETRRHTGRTLTASGERFMARTRARDSGLGKLPDVGRGPNWVCHLPAVVAAQFGDLLDHLGVGLPPSTILVPLRAQIASAVSFPFR